MMNVFIMFGTYIHLTQVYKNVGGRVQEAKFQNANKV